MPDPDLWAVEWRTLAGVRLVVCDGVDEAMRVASNARSCCFDPTVWQM